MNILVVGGGLAGLTSALALGRAGHQITLIEKQPSFQALNLGLRLTAPAVAILKVLGVELDAGLPLTATQTTDQTGTRLLTPAAWSWAIGRRELHAAIIEKLPENVETIFAAPIRTIQNHDDSVKATWTNTAQDFDLVIGADSFASAVRNRLLGPHPLHYSGQTIWRGITDFDLGATAWELWGGQTRISLCPLPEGQTSYAIVANQPSRTPDPKWPDGFDAWTSGFGGPWPALRDTLTERPPYHRDLHHHTAPAWGGTRGLLVGDAAYTGVATPWLGASLAIEDAAAVALTVSAEEAWSAYEKLRADRVRHLDLLYARLTDLYRMSSRFPRLRKIAVALPRQLPNKIWASLDDPGFRLADQLTELI